MTTKCLCSIRSETNYKKCVELFIQEGSSTNKLLSICDQFRDNDMLELGVRITDDAEFPISFVDREILIKYVKGRSVLCCVVFYMC